MQLDIPLTFSAKRAHVPGFRRGMHITALAANIKYRRFVAVQNAFFKGFVQVIENHFVPNFDLRNKLKKVSNILKTFFFCVFLKGGVNNLVFLSFVLSGKR